MTKTALRATMRERRARHVQALSDAEARAAAVALADHAVTLLGDASVVALYIPIRGEVDTGPLIDRLAARGLTIALPQIAERAAPMRFLHWIPGTDLAIGPFGLRQPPADAAEMRPDLIFTPLLAFDARLDRLGYGAGHYDRAFAALPDARRIGLAWAMQAVPRVPVEPWDLPLDAVVTEHEVRTR
jgi:5-formyltetrahydrofolate cyclo-ligase